MSFPFNLGQQGIPQQTLGPQGQVDHHQHTVPGVVNADRARMWQQMQNEVQNQMQQQQFRPQGVGDMGGGQGNNPALVDLLRSQSIPRQHQQQHPMQHAHQQQPFGLGGQMSGVQGGPGMPNQGAHNFQFNQLGSVNKLNPMQLQALAARGVNPNMPNMANQQDFARQLSLMGYPHAQQPNQPSNASNLQAAALRQQLQLQQQQQQQHQQHQAHPNMGLQMTPNPAPNGGLFPNNNANMPHADGMSALLHNGMPAQRPPMQAGAPMTAGSTHPMQVIRDKMQQLTAQCNDLQGQREYLNNHRAGKSELQFQQEMGVLQKGIDDRRGQLQRLAMMFQQMSSRQTAPMNNMAQPPMNQAAAPQNGHAPANWHPQNGPSPVNGFVNQHLSAGILPPNTPLQQNPTINHTPGGLPHMIPQGPPRNGPTPLQLPNAAQHQSSPNMGLQMANLQPNGHPQHNGGPSQALGQTPAQRGAVHNQLPALPLEAFNAAYRQWCQKQGITHDENLMQIDGRKIDLHRLHQEVIAAGTFQKVGENLDQWAHIGARLEFVQFPGTPSTPPKSGPGVAQQLLHVYKTYLAQFDSTYLRSVLVKRFGNQVANPGQRLNQPSNAGPPPGGPPPAGGNGVPAVNGGQGLPTNMQTNANVAMQQQGALSLEALAALFGTQDPNMLRTLLSLSELTPQELHQRGFPPQVVQKVEANRAVLQKTAQQHRARTQHHQQQMQLQQLQQQQHQQHQQHQQQMQQHHQQQQQQQQQQMQQHPPLQAGVPGAPGMPGSSMQQPMAANQGQKPMELPLKQNHPSPEQIRNAGMTIQSLRNRIQMSLPQLPFVNVHESQRLEYAHAFEQLYKQVSELESSSRLVLLACVVPPDVLKKVMDIVVRTQHQRQLLSSQSPKYVLTLDLVRGFFNGLQTLMRNLSQRAIIQPDQGRPPSRPQASISQGFSPPSGSFMPESGPQHPTQPPQPAAASTAPQPPNVHTPQIPHPSPRTQSAQATPLTAPKKKPAVAEAAASSSTPPASVSTPANPPTPGRAADSPQTPKSPRVTKPVPKPKPKRRASVKGQPATPAAASTSTAVATPDHPSPAHPATPESVGTKRKREEDPIAIPQPASTPSPGKKLKTEWEGTPSEELARKKQEVETAGQTDEDAVKFLDSTIEMLAMAANEGSSMPSEVADTIQQILSGLPDNSGGMSSFDSYGRSSSPAPAADIGLDWFDWTSYNEDDHGSKANTPDLVAPPSTNASPGSSESEAGHGSSNTHDVARIADPSKGDDDLLDGSDYLRLGIWNEIEGGGEAAYYNPDTKWQWEGTMPTSDQAWAITGSER